MERRISFFVREAEPTSDGWLLRGEMGLGPLRAGEQFDVVMHEDASEEDASTLSIVDLGPDTLRLVGERQAVLGPGDILLGEVER